MFTGTLGDDHGRMNGGRRKQAWTECSGRARGRVDGLGHAVAPRRAGRGGHASGPEEACPRLQPGQVGTNKKGNLETGKRQCR